MLVDDDEISIMLHKWYLKEIGIHSNLLIFTDGQPAFEYLQQHYLPGETYLVFLDINMPVMKGWTLLEALQGESFCREIKVAIVTSSVEVIDKQCSKNYENVIDFATKPLQARSYQRIMQKMNLLK